MSLFQLGDFTLASGQQSNFKIDCDFLTAKDWETLAQLIVERIGAFDKAFGVPTGGLALADAINAIDHAWDGIPLVVDDVWTTGTSWKQEAARVNKGGLVAGVVVFARNPTPKDVMALFSMETK